MTNFVDGATFGLNEYALWVYCGLFKKTMNSLGRVYEIAITILVAVQCAEHAAVLADIKLLNQAIGRSTDRSQLVGCERVFNHHVTGFPVSVT
jgi:hypothetical protein